MGYEVIYHYRELLDSPGEYDEEIKSRKVKIGQAYEDTPLEALASKIMAQLARRNILIVDVEIFEFTKKRLSYKESEDGILIKNKKFKFDDGPVVEGVEAVNTDDPAAMLSALLQANPGLLNTLQQNVAQQGISHNPPSQINVSENVASGPRLAKRWEVFSPEMMLEHRAKQANMKFTKGKKYPIFEEIQKGVPPLTTTFYITTDDTGKEQEVGAEYFIPNIPGRLSYEDEMVGGPENDDIDLWGGVRAAHEYIEDMPDIRKIR